MKIHGSIVACITPFKDGALDETAFTQLVEDQIKAGTHGIVPCGTTGESPTLSHEEHERVVELAVETAKGRVPVIAGTGSNSTREAIALTQHAASAGAQAALVVTPYYNKPSQEGLYQHFKAIAESVDIAIILYNIPGRTSRNIETETIARLAQDCPNIVGVKEASGSLDQVQAVRLACGDDFIILSGDDALTLPIMSVRGKGVISVAANIIPEKVAALTDALENGDFTRGRTLHFEILPLIKALFLDTNPVPVKEAMALMGRCSSEVRLPLSPLSETNRQQLKQVLTSYGLLNKEAVR